MSPLSPLMSRIRRLMADGERIVSWPPAACIMVMSAQRVTGTMTIVLAVRSVDVPNPFLIVAMLEGIWGKDGGCVAFRADRK